MPHCEDYGYSVTAPSAGALPVSDRPAPPAVSIPSLSFTDLAERDSSIVIDGLFAAV